MTISRKPTFAALFCVAAAAVVLAGCGSSSNDNNTASSSTQGSNASQSTPNTSVAAGTVSTASTSAGTVLVGEGGKTLYLFEADKNGKPTCTGDCAAAWPPAMASGSAKATGDAQMSMVSTVSGSGGKQLAYAGHPLYFFSADKKAGDVNGNGTEAFGAEWYALTPQGKNAEGSASSSSSSNSSSSDSSSSSSSGY